MPLHNFSDSRKNVSTADSLREPILTVDDTLDRLSGGAEALTVNHPWHFYYRQIMQTGMPMALSYTFSLELAAIGLISLHMDNSSKNAAATILSQTVMSMTIRLCLAPLFAISTHACKLFGELQQLQKGDGVLLESGLDTEALKNKKLAEINHTVWAGYVLSVLTMIPAMIILYQAEPMLVALGQSKTIAQKANQFLQPYAVSAPPLAIRMSLGQIMFANRDPNPAMIAGIVTFIIGTGLAVVLANGNDSLSVKPMGLKGIAWALNIESILTPLCYMAYLLKNKKYQHIQFISWRGLQRESITDKFKTLMEIGMPIFMTMSVETTLGFVLSVFAGLKSTEDQANLSYSMQVAFILFVFLMGFGQATSNAVGKAMGQEEYRDASQFAKVGTVGTVASLIPISVFICVFPQLLYPVFSIKGQEARSEVKKLVPIVVSGAVMQAARYNMNQVVRILGDHKQSAIVSASGMLMGIGVAAVLGFCTPAGIAGISAGLVIGEGLAAVGLFPSWQQRAPSEKIKAYHIQTNSDQGI